MVKVRNGGYGEVHQEITVHGRVSKQTTTKQLLKGLNLQLLQKLTLLQWLPLLELNLRILDLLGKNGLL